MCLTLNFLKDLHNLNKSWNFVKRSCSSKTASLNQAIHFLANVHWGIQSKRSKKKILPCSSVLSSSVSNTFISKLELREIGFHMILHVLFCNGNIKPMSTLSAPGTCAVFHTFRGKFRSSIWSPGRLCCKQMLINSLSRGLISSFKQRKEKTFVLLLQVDKQQEGVKYCIFSSFSFVTMVRLV